MADEQINDLGFVADVDDQATGPAKAAADALRDLGTQADVASAGLDAVDKSGTATASTVSTRLLPSTTQMTRALDDAASTTAKLAANEAQRQRYLDGLAASTGAATAAGLTYEQAVAKINDRYDAAAAKILGVKSAQQELVASFDAGTAALQRQTAAMQASTSAAEAQASINSRLGVGNGFSSAADSAGVFQAAAATAAAEAHANVIRSAQDARAAQERFNTSLGVTSEAMGTAQESAVAMAAAMDKERSAIDNLYRTSKAYEAELLAIDKAVANGTVTEQRATALRADAQKSFETLSTSMKGVEAGSGQAGFALRQLGVQAVQGFSGIATGQPIMTTLIQQGHQVFDVALSTGVGLRSMGTAALSMVGGISGLSTALGVGAGLGLLAGMAALGVSAEHQQEQLAALGVQMRATRTDAAAMTAEITMAAKASSGPGTGLSRSDATTAGKIIGSTYDFVGTTADLTNLIGVSQRLALVMNETVPDAAKTLSQALMDPGAVAEDLAKTHFPGMSRALADSISRMQTAGEQGKAFAAVMQVIQANTVNARTDGLTPFQQALDNLRDHFNAPIQGGKSLAQAIGDDIDAAATKGIGALDAYIERLKYLYSNPAASASDLAMTAIGLNQGPVRPGNTAGLTTNPTSGALGLMQIMPGLQQSFANQGIDITTEAGNVRAGLQVLSDGLAKYNGNLNQALGYYGGFSDVNSTGAKAYAASVMRKDESSLSSSTARTIYDGAQSAGMGRYATVAQRIALQESGGRQMANPLSTPMDTSLTGATVGSGYPSYVNDNDALSASGTKAASSYASWSDQAAAIKANIQAMTAYRAQLDPTSAAYATLSDKIAVATGDLRNAKSGQALLTQSMQDGLAPLSAAAGYQRTMAEVTNQFTLKAKEQAGGVVDLTALHGALSAKQRELATAFEDGTSAVGKQTDAQQGIIDAYGKGAAAVQHVTDRAQAMAAAGDAYDKSSPAYVKAVQDRTKALDNQAAVQARAQVAGQNAQSQDNLAYIQAETTSIGQNAQQRAVMLAQMQAELAMHRQFGDVLPVEAQRYIALQGQIASATVSYQQQQQALSDLSGGVSNVFSTLGDDISQAFAQGAGSAITFKNVLAGLETQVASLAVKFAIINPALNSLGLSSTHLSTLGDVSSALSGSTALSSGSGGAGGTSILGGLSSLGSTFSLGNVASSGSNLLASIGIGSGAISGTAGAVGSGFLSSGLDLGSAAGSAGAGSGFLGSLGSFAGAVAPFAAVAGIGIPLISSLFGGHKKNPYTLDTVSTAGGQLSIGSSYNQAEDDKYTAQLASDISSLNATFKSLGLTVSAGNGNAQGNLGIVGDGAGNAQGSIVPYLNAIRFGGASGTFGQALNDNVAGGFSSNDLSSVSSFQAAITSLKTMADTVDQLHVVVSKFDADAGTVNISHLDTYVGDLGTALNKALSGTTQTASTLAATISTISANVENIHALQSATVMGTSQFQSGVASITSTYQAAIAQAQAYGLSTDALVAKQKELTDAQYATARAGLESSNQDMKVRQLTAQGDAEGAALLTHDNKADADYKALDASFQAIYGAAWQSADAYETDRTQLIATESAERLQIERQYQDASTAAATAALQAQQQQQQTALNSTQSLLSGISDYATTLNTSSAGGLSTRDQYANARSSYQAVATAADAGDSAAAGKLVSAAQTFLSLSSTFNAGGAAYTADVANVRGALAGVAGASDAITTSFLAGQNSNVVDGLSAVKDEIAKLRRDISTAALVRAAA